MALKWIEGFEAPDTSATFYGRKYASGSGAGTQAGRVSGNAAACGATSLWRTPSLGSDNKWTIGIGYHGPNSGVGTVDTSVRLFQGATEQIRLRIFAGSGAALGSIAIMRGATVIATPVTNLSLNGWHYIEFQVNIDTGTAGTLELRVDEVSVYTNAGTNTANAGSAGADVVSWGGSTGSSQVFLDDIYVLDSTIGDSLGNTTFRGDSQIKGFKPNANGSIQQWTPSSGTNHATLLADTNDSSFISDSTVGHEDFQNFEDPSLPAGTVFGIMLTSLANLDLSGSRQFAMEYYDGVAHTFPTSHVVGSTAIAGFVDCVEANPSTATNWTSADLNAAQFGPKVTV